MTAADVDAVHEIETACFKTPWSKESFLHEIEENQCARYVVVREDGKTTFRATTSLLWKRLRTLLLRRRYSRR